MSHLDEGQLILLRDHESDGADPAALRHVEECARCSEALSAARSRVPTIEGALIALDSPDDDGASFEDARDAIRARIAGHSAERAGAVSLTARRRRGVRALPRAAGILLVTAAGVAAAIPGSPVRGWIGGLFEERPAAIESSQPAAPEVTAAGESVGVRVGAAAGAVHVLLSSVPPGTEIDVHWVGMAEASVFAPVGTRFSSGEGRIDATVAGGPVRIELPASDIDVTLEVDGVLFLQRSGERLETPGPGAESGASGVVFRVPAG